MSLNPVHRTLNALQCTYLSVGGMEISKYMLRHLFYYHGFKFRSKERTLLLTMKQREERVEKNPHWVPYCSNHPDAIHMDDGAPPHTAVRTMRWWSKASCRRISSTCLRQHKNISSCSILPSGLQILQTSIRLRIFGVNSRTPTSDVLQEWVKSRGESEALLRQKNTFLRFSNIGLNQVCFLLERVRLLKIQTFFTVYHYELRTKTQLIELSAGSQTVTRTDCWRASRSLGNDLWHETVNHRRSLVHTKTVERMNEMLKKAVRSRGNGTLGCFDEERKDRPKFSEEVVNDLKIGNSGRNPL